jgi:long-chain acyl-CoA synthetase
MNLAHWLDRAGRDDPQRPALGLGSRVVRTYGETAGRVARLAGALRGMGLEPGDRVAIVAKNSPDYVEILYAVWHAGLAAVPANAKLHGAELGYILEQSGARLCFASDGLDGEIAAHAPQGLERLLVIGGTEYERLFAADPVAVAERQGDDLAWQFYTSGTTGRSRRDFARRPDRARGADEPRLGPLHHALHHAARRQRRAGIGRLRAGGNLRPVRRLAA